MITDVRLQHFRSYSDAAFEFEKGVNIIVGPNASGKTNLLESILVATTGSSYRVSDQDLIAFNQPWARLQVHTNNEERVVKLLRDGLNRRVFEIDGKVYKRLSQEHTLPIVLFEPEHLTLLSGAPEQRRNYLDDLLSQTEPGYRTLRRNYKRALAQRNALLRYQPGKAEAQLFPWNVRLTELAGQMVRARANLVGEINAQLSDLYQELSHSKHIVRLEYQSDFSPEHYETKFMHKLEISLETDRERGFTGSGPHREDFLTLYDEHSASETASRGESRTAVLALKIIELQILERSRGHAPLLLLDDVFSELDGSRRKLLTKYIERYQSFITTTDADIVVQNFTESCNVIPLG
jgi:DNA replication and repair protein RecF